DLYRLTVRLVQIVSELALKFEGGCGWHRRLQENRSAYIMRVTRINAKEFAGQQRGWRCGLRSAASLRSNCSRAIWRPIRRASDITAASLRARSFRSVSGPVEGVTSILILFRLTAIV